MPLLFQEPIMSESTQQDLDIDARYACAKSLALEAAQLGMDFYRQRETLDVEHKGNDRQDVVSIADKNIEDFIRARLAERFPQDGFLGEESGSADLKARCVRSEEHTSELQSLMRISYAVICLKKK